MIDTSLAKRTPMSDTSISTASADYPDKTGADTPVDLHVAYASLAALCNMWI